MDDPHADPRLLERTYAQFALVNRFVSRWRGVYVRDIRPRARKATAQRMPVRILDVGAGGADLARAVTRWLRRDGLDGQVTALDTDARAVRWASAQAGSAAIEHRTAQLAELAANGDTYDLVLSNHVLHHLPTQELTAFLDDSRALVRPGGAVAHHDLERSTLAYHLFAAVTWPLQSTVLSDSFIRADGLTSIRRSYTTGELTQAAPDGWTVRRRAPARLELRWEHDDA